MAFCLKSCIWQLISSNRILVSARSFVISCPGLLVTRAGFRVMTLRQSNNLPNFKVQTHRDQRRWDRRRVKSRACLSFSLTSRGLFTKNSSWQAKQSVLHTTVTLYGYCMKMYKDFSQILAIKELAVATRQHSDSLPFSPGNLSPKTIWLSSHTHPTCLTWPPATFLFPQLEDKTE
jgi:hypothetical protein